MEGKTDPGPNFEKERKDFLFVQFLPEDVISFRHETFQGTKKDNKTSLILINSYVTYFESSIIKSIPVSIHSTTKKQFLDFAILNRRI